MECQTIITKSLKSVSRATRIMVSAREQVGHDLISKVISKFVESSSDRPPVINSVVELPEPMAESGYPPSTRSNPEPTRVEQPSEHNHSVQNRHESTGVVTTKSEKYSSGLHLVPEVELANKTRLRGIAATTIGTCLAIFCVAFGIYTYTHHSYELAMRLPVQAGSWKASMISVAVNVVISFSQDGMAFVHSVSLRWALYREGRLEYNTNIRLLTHSQTSGPNRWPANMLSLASLILCYGASSLLIVTGEAEDVERDGACWGLGYTVDSSYAWLNAPALCALGVGLGLQASLAAWCLWNSRSNPIPTWNPDALNTTLAAINGGLVVHRPDRCMLSVHQRNDTSPISGAFPMARQGTIWHANRRVLKRIMFFIWANVVGYLAWPLVVYLIHWYWGFYVTWAEDCYLDSTGTPIYHKNFVFFSMSPLDMRNPDGNAWIPYSLEQVLGVLYACLIQSSQTYQLHCVELLVNMTRDEKAWRKLASNDNGGNIVDDALISAISSWENALLFMGKVLLHWVLGEAMRPTLNPNKDKFWFQMGYSRLLVYSILAIAMAVFATYLALRRYDGCQPAALGHMQTLADLVDDWTTDGHGRIWWGDKTGLCHIQSRCRHAGTSCRKEELGPILVKDLYM